MSDKKARILFAQPSEEVVILKVIGRGNFELSPSLKAVFDRFTREGKTPYYIIDIEQCPSLDSTFMGAMASMGLQQMKEHNVKIKVLNTNATTDSQLEKLGLKYLMDIHQCGDQCPGKDLGDEDFQVSKADTQSLVDRIVHMIESHEALIDAYSGNELEFRLVLDSLNKSLEDNQPEE